jgi:hypothetical protein
MGLDSIETNIATGREFSDARRPSHARMRAA